MSEIATPLMHVLEATGYLADGEPATSVHLGEDVRRARALPSLQPDARWHNRAHNLNVYFKYSAEKPDNAQLARWHKDVWNDGTSPLLWVVWPERVELYNGFGAPQSREQISRNRLGAYGHSQLGELDRYAGRLAMETGQFWREETRVNRRNAVDRRLLHHLRWLQAKLIADGLPVLEAQGLIGRSIFTKYLVDRGIITKRRLQAAYGQPSLENILRDRTATVDLFGWLRDTFNGDMFPPGGKSVPATKHLKRMARFLEGETTRGQKSFFPYQFDVIPVELISAIYEQFVHSKEALDETENSAGVHYTPVSVVSLVLDEIMQGLTGNETVLDITCGSGVFLVEALRRLVRLKAGGQPPSRSMIRETLYEQIHGVDISERAVRVAAFSLVLAALELDPDPSPSRSLRFKELQGNSLFVGNAYDIETTDAGSKLAPKGELRKFDVIVGNPPWGRTDRGHLALSTPQTKGATSLRYLQRARAFADEGTRFGMVLSATAFFSRDPSRLSAAQDLVESLSPLTLVNLSCLSAWLFDTASMPAMVLMARYRDQPAEEIELVQAEWSPSGAQNRVIETLPSDVASLPIQSWRRNPALLKAALYGKLHDQLLIDAPHVELRPLGDELSKINVSFSQGLKIGSEKRDAGHLQGLPTLAGLHPFKVQTAGKFEDAEAERPRERATYEAPLLLVQEFMRQTNGGGRTVVAVARSDVLFPVAFIGASFRHRNVDLALLLAGILSSAFASWYFTMAASEIGIWKRRLFPADVESIPVPDLGAAIGSETGKRIIALVQSLESRNLRTKDWYDLDEAVFDLYRLTPDERLVVNDGLTRNGWQWDKGRRLSVAPASREQMRAYAGAFVGELDPWFEAARERRLSAEVVELASSAPFRVVRFVLEEAPPPSAVRFVAAQGSFSDLVTEMSDDYRIDASKKLADDGELRIDQPREVVFVKPAATRHWLSVVAMDDARRVLEESFQVVVG